jgi:hypothetical protein
MTLIPDTWEAKIKKVMVLRWSWAKNMRLCPKKITNCREGLGK